GENDAVQPADDGKADARHLVMLDQLFERNAPPHYDEADDSHGDGSDGNRELDQHASILEAMSAAPTSIQKPPAARCHHSQWSSVRSRWARISAVRMRPRGEAATTPCRARYHCSDRPGPG